MIAIDKRTGYTDDIPQLRSFREEFAANQGERRAIAICENSLEMLKGLREINELRIADELLPPVLRLAACIRKESPRVFVAAYIEAAQLDVEFERYDSAQMQISTALKVATDEKVGQSRIQAYRALILRKQKRFDEAKKIYFELLRQARQASDGLTEDDSYEIRFASAALYAEQGDFQKYTDTMPDSGRKAIYKNGIRDYVPEIIKASAIVNYNLTAEGNINVAADKAQQLVERTQQYYGASSRRHIEAIELLAKVRLAQSQNDDAIKLLKQAAELRVGLLGKEHPSIARVNKEIDAIGKQRIVK